MKQTTNQILIIILWDEEVYVLAICVCLCVCGPNSIEKERDEGENMD